MAAEKEKFDLATKKSLSTSQAVDLIRSILINAKMKKPLIEEDGKSAGSGGRLIMCKYWSKILCHWKHLCLKFSL